MADQLDVYDEALELAMKLYALLLPTYGESGTHFRAMQGEIQDAYLWACADMAGQLKELVHGLAIPKEVAHG